MRIVAIVALFLLIPSAVFAQEDASSAPPVEQEYLEKAQVIEASASKAEQLPGTGVTTQTQDLTVKVIEGPDKGVTASFENNYTQVGVGDVVYVRHASGGYGTDRWSLSDPYRIPILLGLAFVFIVLIGIFGGWQGLRGLASLIGSFFLIFGLLLPGVYHGIPPAPLSIGIAALIIIVGSYITHGWNRTTTAAVFGMLATIICVGAGAYVAVHAAHLSGFTTEENVYLNFNTGGSIDMVGLLYGGIMIGLLGVLYDIAIGQAVAIEELLHAGKEMTRQQIYRRGLRIGREHIGALINTLAIAYVGTALPLLLLLHDSNASIEYMVNSELFATEIIRILVGSIGLILAVPITTLIAAHYIRATDTSTGHTHSGLHS
jgi:uncharacterized membrane protein